MALLTLPADTAILLRADGTNWNGNAVVKNLEVDYDRKTTIVTTLQNNQRAFTEWGDTQPWIDHFTLEAWDDATARQIKANVGKEDTEGIFTLKVPDLEHGTEGASPIDWFLIRFFECDFTPDDTTPRRRGMPSVHVAEVSDIEVLEHTTT